ncbi:LuxR family transcriptional regulator [Phaeobacter sp. PT47_59]|uniref:helix-turn-helix transcriptional regulator n=1 Tax=Phaeobacter sp. PT47_59 TaxID=3029979 RepID=UPI0023809660|nr:LuxR family transcriptional regulator [Phaeobacter sp. PT47_59]MDE4175771.1 LuxR family transcriptional regulator [Phaeobacter sp. PT47_59]
MRNDIRGVLLKSLEEISQKGFSVGVGFNDAGEPSFVHSSYERAWVDRYVEASYLLVDPTIQYGLCSTGHITWKGLERLYPDTKAFFADAASYGLTEGNTLAFSLDGTTSILSCSGPEWNKNELCVARAALLGLHGLQLEEGQPSQLSSGVKDVLCLMCSGCRDEEISIRLNVKIETVRSRRRSAMISLDAKNSAQLISKVIKFGLI